MPQVITYLDQNGRRAVVWPAPDTELTLAEIAAKDVPQGLSWQIVDSASILPDPAEVLAATRAAIDAERDRRARGTFTFQGHDFDCDQVSLQRMSGAATWSGFAMAAGALPGNLRWHGGTEDFGWIAADNTLVPMDAQTCFAFCQAAAANESAHVFAARALKDMDPIPANWAADEWWP